ncbi:thiosulfate sulfurtransferase/rhodanese-like domain-containing protein 2 [Ptychodera flava]|uniref:thiosulfate sulfurtransferase/rhodanese-like domain-containing protein 2 n=1 Tax=Ptychodera flava TaxID=63121 RepID=UPI00396A2B3D
MKGGIRTKKGPKTQKKLARRKAFALFVKTLRSKKDDGRWMCCNEDFSDIVKVHKHVAMVHRDNIDKTANHIIQDFEVKGQSGRQEGNVSEDATMQHCSSTEIERPDDGCHDDEAFHYQLPTLEEIQDVETKEVPVDGQILLYYKYTDIDNPQEVCDWQENLCSKLKLTGKVRIAREGLNGTVGGSLQASQLYIKYTRLHASFSDMSLEDFKTSPGNVEDFPDGLRVTVHTEIVPMGVDPQQISYHQAGGHLTVDEFHDTLQKLNTDGNQDTVLVDCRNFYESKIGKFTSALAPNIRKFSYWPEYVEKNLHVFENKKVLMYCTGGIRCERGSAYLRSKSICKEVLQLKGGIHKYIEKYPNGYFRGKLFVFDERFAMPANSDVISECTYCRAAWDSYRPCTSKHCHQLVLSCRECRQRGRTACCEECQRIADDLSKDIESRKEEIHVREECSCTRLRDRIPVEKS